MGNYSVIKDVGETLKVLLESISWDDLALSGEDTPTILLKSPKELEKESNKYLISLFLYQVQENVYLKNQGMQQTDSLRLNYPPISLDLFYIVIPYVNVKEQNFSDQDREIEHQILGKVIQKFHDHTILSGSVLKGSLEGSTEELRLILHPISLDDLNKLWTSFPEIPYRLSVSYMVTPVDIQSTKGVEVKRVIEKESGFYEMEKNV